MQPAARGAGPGDTMVGRPMAPPRTSIVLPVCNGERHLAEAVESILDQTDSDLELVVVDDGSTDKTPEILAGLVKRDSRARTARQPHGGVVRAANRGMEMARGAYIARMDADDVSLPERIEVQAGYLDDHSDVDLVASQVEYLGDAARNRGLAVFVERNNTVLSPSQIELDRFVETPIIQPSVMFRRDLPERFGGYRDGPFPEDYELWLRWLEAGVRMAKIDRPLLQWRETEGRLTRTDPRYSVDAFYRTKTPYLYRWLTAHNPHHPDVVIWGSGRTSRQRQRELIAMGVRVRAYVDIDPRKIGYKIGGAPVVWPEKLPDPAECFVLGWVASRGAREDIESRLEARGFEKGRSYISCA